VLNFLGALENGERCVFVFALELRFDDAVDSGLRRLPFLQVTQETVYGVFCAFEENFYSCVAAVPNVTC
jgi:hypothetical protein